MPATAQAMPARTRPVSRSPRNTRDISATTPGSAAMITPAASAVLMATPYSMQIENRKLPRKLSKKSSTRSWRARGVSLAGRRTQPAIATAAMPKRSQASRKIGKTATSSLDSPT